MTSTTALVKRLYHRQAGNHSDTGIALNRYISRQRSRCTSLEYSTQLHRVRSTVIKDSEFFPSHPSSSDLDRGTSGAIYDPRLLPSHAVGRRELDQRTHTARQVARKGHERFSSSIDFIENDHLGRVLRLFIREPAHRSDEGEFGCSDCTLSLLLKCVRR